jgi:hypothetical protein
MTLDDESRKKCGGWRDAAAAPWAVESVIIILIILMTRPSSFTIVGEHPHT